MSDHSHRDVLTHEFEALRALATQVINDHIDDSGLCVVCGCAFPCDHAVVAEHNLGLLRDTRCWTSRSAHR